jgi:hypothetical protein
VNPELPVAQLPRTLVLLAGLAVVGCSKPAVPTTAGGHPVAYWLDEVKNPDPRARKKAVRALGHVGPADPAAVPAVTESLKDEDAAVRQEACLALLNLGPAAAEADAALIAATQDPDPKVR